MSNEELAYKIAKIHYRSARQITDSQKECYDSALEMAEWKDEYLPKHIITNHVNRLVSNVTYSSKQLLAFHTFHQRELFHEENEDLIKEYFMID